MLDEKRPPLTYTALDWKSALAKTVADSRQRETELLRQAGELIRGKLLTVNDLLVMSKGRDPFDMGSVSHKERAQWFARLAEKMPKPFHLRLIHYAIVAASINMPRVFDKKSGTFKVVDRKHTMGDKVIRTPKYVNSDNAWKLLSDAATAARVLGLVPWEWIIDEKNPTPHPYGRTTWDGVPTSSPEVRDPLAQRVSHYTPSAVDLQPSSLYLIVEKSTMNYIFQHVCEELGITLITFTGVSTVTAIYDLVKDIYDQGRPANIAYWSDLDPAGYNMVASFSWWLYFFHQTFSQQGFDMPRITLERMALDAATVHDLDLVTVPTKDTARMQRFTVATAKELTEHTGEEHGGYTEIVELDSLVAADPGAPERIIREWASKYRHDEAEQVSADYRKKLIAMYAASYNAIYKKRKYQEAIALIREMNNELEQVRHSPSPPPVFPVKHGGEGGVLDTNLSMQEQLLTINDFYPPAPKRSRAKTKGDSQDADNS